MTWLRNASLAKFAKSFFFPFLLPLAALRFSRIGDKKVLRPGGGEAWELCVGCFACLQHLWSPQPVPPQAQMQLMGEQHRGWS